MWTVSPSILKKGRAVSRRQGSEGMRWDAVVVFDPAPSAGAEGNEWHGRWA